MNRSDKRMYIHIFCILMFLTFLLFMSGCASIWSEPKFDFMSKKHTNEFTAKTLAEIQHDYCALDTDGRHSMMRRINRWIEWENENGGWLLMGCNYEPKLPFGD